MGKIGKRKVGWIWVSGLVFAAGYLGAAMAMWAKYGRRAPVIGTAAAVAVTIPIAARIPGLLRGALRGLMLGVAGAAGVILAMIGPGKSPPGEAVMLDITITAFTTMICCTVAGAVFALLAERRHRLLDGGGR